MISRSVTEAKAELSRLLVLAENGEDVVITRGGRQVVKLVLVESDRQPRKLGLLRGKFVVPDDFDALDTQIVELFEAE